MTLKFWKNIKLTRSLSRSYFISALIAEFFGTGIYIFIGCLGTTSTDYNAKIETAFAFGLAFMVAIQCFGHISGHVNPLISLTAVVVGELSVVNGLIYVIAQFLGGLAGFSFSKSVLLKTDLFATGSSPKNKTAFCSAVLSPDSTCIQGIFTEFTISFILVMAISASWDARNRHKTDSVPVRLGLVITGLMIATKGTTQGHLNPVRTLAPAIINNHWKDVWVYIVGQILGGLVAAIFFAIVFYQYEEPEEEENPPEET